MPCERLILSEYEVEETLPSVFAKGKWVTTVIGIKCPRCKTRSDVLRHGSIRTCAECGLSMLVDRQHLHIWGDVQ